MHTLTLLYGRLAALYWRMLAWFHVAMQSRRPAQGLVEYGLILVLIMVLCVAILSIIGKNVSDAWYEPVTKAFK